MGAEVVVQLGQSLAAAQTALLLGRFGARVVRVSGQGGAPDHWIARRPCARHTRTAPWPSTPGASSDAAALRSLLERVDVVVDDRPLSYWSERGVDLRALYEGDDPPRAIWCGITPYGLAGIGAGWEGTELTEQASGPMLLRIGEPGRPPLPMKGPQAEVGAGWHAAAAVAGLRFSCERGSPGTLLDVSIQECLYMHSELGAVNWFYNGLEISHWLNAKPTAAASGYPTRDGRTVHMLFHDREWPRVARMIGRPDLERDDRFMARYKPHAAHGGDGRAPHPVVPGTDRDGGGRGRAGVGDADVGRALARRGPRRSPAPCARQLRADRGRRRAGRLPRRHRPPLRPRRAAGEARRDAGHPPARGAAPRAPPARSLRSRRPRRGRPAAPARRRARARSHQHLGGSEGRDDARRPGGGGDQA